MRLRELSETTGTTQASIKFYLREGLLPQGRRVNATLAEYDETHVERLRLIAALRQIVGAPIQEIRDLIARIDDPGQDLYTVLGRAQLIGLGLPGSAVEARREADEPDVVTRLLDARGWVHADEVRALLADQVRSMERLGMPVTDDVLTVYADAVDLVAEAETGTVKRARSRDEAVLWAAVGTHVYGALLLRLLAVAQAGRAREV